jgi:hypothetical protein
MDKEESRTRPTIMTVVNPFETLPKSSPRCRLTWGSDNSFAGVNEIKVEVVA